MKVVKKILIIVFALILVFCIAAVCLRLIPINRTFSSVYEGDPYSEVFIIPSSDLPETMILGSDTKPYHYQAYSGWSACYIYSGTKLVEDQKISRPSRLIGIAIYSTDNSGIWMKYPVFVYEI